MNPTKEQLIAYFSGMLSRGEKDRVEEWLSGHPDKELVEECIRIAMDSMVPVEEDAAADDKTAAGMVPAGDEIRQAYARFRKLTDVYLLQSSPAPARSGKRSGGVVHTLFRYGAAAAIILILSLAGFSLYRHFSPVEAKQQLAILSVQRIYQAAPAAITRIQLSDGSIVRLFPGSSLTVSDSFNVHERVVGLNGRGYFEVAGNPMHPFYVRSRRISTRVLGTAFEVNMDQKNYTRVVVTEGKVRVVQKDSVLSDLVPDQGIVIDDSSGRWKVQHLDAGSYCSWTKGELGFRQTSLKEILPVLEKWFNVNFQVKRAALLDRKLTFFIRRQDLREAMEVLSNTAGFSYLIQPGGPAPAQPVTVVIQ